MPPRKHGSQRRTVTMRDVARLANVSQSTVSRVLSGSTSGIPIGDETKERVYAAVKQLGYYPNLYAGSLRGQKTRMIAMLIADIANPFYHPMVRAVQDVARSYGYDVMVANSDHRRDGEQLFCEAIMRRPVDGVVMVPYHMTDDDIEELVTRTDVAVALVGQHFHHPQSDVVFADDGKGVVDAVTWLIAARRHQRIGFIGITEAFPAGARRWHAFQETLERARLPFPEEYYQEGDWTAESGERAMHALLSLSTPPTAVFACNDLMAIGAMQTAWKMGLRVPDDVAIVGFDDIPAASWIRPRLTTIAQYPAKMGRALATALFERINEIETGPARRYEIPCCFIARESA